MRIEKELIEKLKRETVKGLGPKVEINSVSNYKIRVVSRGEQLFYQQDDKALLCQMDPYNYVIYTKSLNKWDNDVKISDTEKELIIDRLKSYFLRFQNTEVKVV